MADLNWTEAQWRIIEQAIADEVENSRLAHKLIPEYKLPPDTRTVPSNRYNYAPNAIDDAIIETPIKLHEEEEAFSLTKLQTEDENLNLARTRVRRAAQQLARRHDQAVFRTAIRNQIDEHAQAGDPGFHPVIDIDPPYSDGLVSAVTDAVAKLDGQGYRTGYVMVAGQNVYTQLHTRAQGAADLPVKAVQGLLDGGPVHRSAVLDNLDKDEALILSISGDALDRAVSIAPTLEFLRIGNNANREFRLYERFSPRFKQTYSAVLLRVNRAAEVAPSPDAQVLEAITNAVTLMAGAADRAAKAAEEAAAAATAAAAAATAAAAAAGGKKAGEEPT